MKIKSYRLFWILSLTTLFDFALLAYRLYYIEYDFSEIQSLGDLAKFRSIPTFLFLVWNLFLAWIPYWFSMLLEKTKKFKLLTILILFGWLLFFPNAPYLVTDLLHLKSRSPVPMWYDVFLFFCFAWTGLMLGFSSLLEVKKFLDKRFAGWLTNSFVICSTLLCGFGVFIGRFQRWNSWDLFTNPFQLFSDLFLILGNPFDYMRTFGLAVVASILILLGFWTLTILIKEYSEKH